MSTKRILLVSKSKLSQNLFDMIIGTIQRKIEFVALDDPDLVQEHYFHKTVQLIIVDNNSLSNGFDQEMYQNTFGKKNLKNAKKILIYSREIPCDQDMMKKLGFTQIFAKPFLPEELIDLVSQKLGIQT